MFPPTRDTVNGAGTTGETAASRRAEHIFSRMEQEQIQNFVRRCGCRIVGLQLPEGMKARAAEAIAQVEEATGATVILSGEPCFGACDTADMEMARAGIEALIHVGHTAIGNQKTLVPVLYIPHSRKGSVGPAVAKAVPLLKSPVGLLTVAQHLDELEAASAVLVGAGLEVAVGPEVKGVLSSGQILGCDVRPARHMASRVSSFLFLGSGVFHPLVVQGVTGKPTVACDHLGGVVQEITPLLDGFLKQRYGLISKASNAQRIGVIVGTKSGQIRLALAGRLVRRLRGTGREAHLLAMGTITPDAVRYLKFDAFVSTACPRIAPDDAAAYPKPLLTPPEIEMAAGLRPLEPYMWDEFYR